MQAKLPLRWIEVLAVSLLCVWGTAAYGRAPWNGSKLKGAPTPPEPYRVEPAFPGVRFEKPTSLEEIPDANQLLVTEIGGKLWRLDKRARTRELLLDLKAQLPPQPADASVSLFDAEFHPNFEDQPFLYICYVHPGDGGHTRVSRFSMRDLHLAADSEQVLMTWPSGGHNGGCLEFGSDGFLYISTGDGSGPNPPDGLTTGQDISDLLGAILRIDVDHRDAGLQYSIPSDNPFRDQETARAEIWAYGLRNPWKFGIAPDNVLYIADNGWESWELIHRATSGSNCGWPVMEGRALLRSEVPVGPTAITPPLKDHPHSEANSVIGGPVYTGQKLPQLQGFFVYGDYITGTIWGIGTQDQNYSHATLLDTDLRITAFTQGSEGELYVLDYDYTGEIYQLLPSNTPDTSADFPRRLSETGLFESLTPPTPAAGVLPYEVIAERWTDGATARRWIAVPGDGTVRLGEERGESEFPEGTVLVKELSLPREADERTLLETQILHFEGGRWNPYTYLWNEAGDDAELVDAIGATLPLGAEFEHRTWHVSSANECKLCHNAGSGNVLGFVPNQLNQRNTSSQLKALTQQGLLSEAPAHLNPKLALVPPHDSEHSLPDRARSYLHANCSMCHHPGGNAIVSFYLRRDLPFGQMNTSKGTGIGTFGLRNARIIAPGDANRSVLLYRMTKLGYARMPYIGSKVVDGKGVALVSEWIDSLRPEDNLASALAKADSAESQALTRVSAASESNGAVQDALAHLVSSSEGALALAIRLHAGGLPNGVASHAIAAGSRSARTNIRGLFDGFLPESERRAVLGANVDPQVVLQEDGDAGRGKLIFYSDAARCRNCHDASNPKVSLGPTLAEIRKKYPRRSELLQHILQPSLKVDEKFAAFAAFLEDGRVLTGVIAGERPQLILRTSGRESVSVPRAEVEELKQVTRSLMPDRLLSDLTAQEAADLLAFLQQEPDNHLQPRK